VTLSQFDTLLTEADACAQRGAWHEAFGFLSQAAALDPEHPGTQTGLGTCLIHLGRAADSLPFFERAVALAPNSPEAANNLGVASALVGNAEAAESAFTQALGHDPEHASAWKNLAQLYLRQSRFADGVSILAALVQAHPDDGEALRLMAACYEEAGETDSARALYGRALKLQPDDADALAAIARLGVPEAARVAKPEHLSKLASLKSLKGSNSRPAPVTSTNGRHARPHTRSVAFYAPPRSRSAARFSLAARALAGSQVRVNLAASPTPADLGNYDTLVFAGPHVTPQLADQFAALNRAGKRVIVDLDQNFTHLSPDQADRVLAQACLVTIASPALAGQVNGTARRVDVVPDAWSRDNFLWDKPAPRRATLNLGWDATCGDRADLALIRQAVVRMVRETPEALLVIAGDPAAYEDFAMLPEARRLYLPPMSYEDHPYVLAHFDIQLLPAHEGEFGCARSDLAVLEAGVRRVPWVASPLPAYHAWQAAGLFADNTGDWYTALKRLAGDPALRRELGEAGRRQAEAREAQACAAAWQQALLADSCPD
jgi:Flp pilus assembly protein TadD